MTFPLDPEGILIIVPTRVEGPAKEHILRFAIDTGATRSLISWDQAIGLGYDPATIPSQVEIFTASSVEYAPLVRTVRIEAMNHERRGLPIACHRLPEGVNIDGVLGLDFFRGRKLTLDFRVGLVTLE